MRYLTTAFSLNMIGSLLALGTVDTQIYKVSLEEARKLLPEGGFTSAVGHASTIPILAKLLEQPIALNRATVDLGAEDDLVIAQYVGDRLPEGATELPPGARIDWIHLRRSKLREAVMETLGKTKAFDANAILLRMANLANGQREAEVFRELLREECNLAWWSGHNDG